MESNITPNPGSLKNHADCDQLAEHEWDTKQVDHDLWKDRDAYVKQRGASLRSRLRKPPTKEVSPPPPVPAKKEGK